MSRKSFTVEFKAKVAREKRLALIAEAKTGIERRAAERYAVEKAAHEKKLEERAKKEQETGKKPRGKQPKPPQAGPTKKDQVDLTDGQSRIMPVSGGGFVQGRTMPRQEWTRNPS